MLTNWVFRHCIDLGSTLVKRYQPLTYQDWSDGMLSWEGCMSTLRSKSSACIGMAAAEPHEPEQQHVMITEEYNWSCNHVWFYMFSFQPLGMGAWAVYLYFQFTSWSDGIFYTGFHCGLWGKSPSLWGWELGYHQIQREESEYVWTFCFRSCLQPPKPKWQAVCWVCWSLGRVNIGSRSVSCIAEVVFRIPYPGIGRC